MCGPRGLVGAENILYENLGGGKFKDVTKVAHIDRTNGKFCFSVATLDDDDDGWPDMLVACDSQPSILYHNNHDGTFTDEALTAGVAFNEDGREQAWARQWVISTAMGAPIFSKRISPRIRRRYTATTGTANSWT
jgi:enediyne biosynthesis protein E4